MKRSYSGSALRRLVPAAGAALVLLGAAWVEAAAEQGIRGRAALGGTLVEGVSVAAYPYRPGGFGPLTGDAPVAQAGTATDGTYAIPLPPGRYVVEALRKKPGNAGARPETGDLQCLYSGSPVTVSPGAWTAVGLNLVEVPPEARRSADRSTVSGAVTLGGAPAEKVYLYAYAGAEGAFRGPAYLLQPVASGAFSVRLPAGTYHLVARKRVRGGAYGPIEIGDLFNFYSRNPVTVAQGEEVVLEIPLVERLSQLEEDPKAFHGRRVRVVTAAGEAAKGFHVLAYANPLRAGPPLAVSAPTDPEGWTLLPVAPDQALFLRARRSLGGPVEEGESFADGELPAAAGSEPVLTLGGVR